VKLRYYLVGLLVFSLIVSGCETVDTTGAPDHEITTAPTRAVEAVAQPTTGSQIGEVITVDPIENAALEAATAIAITASPDGSIFVLYGAGSEIYVVEINEDNTLANPVQVNGDAPAYLSAIEPPAIIADADGRVHVAWMSMEGMLSDFWYARSDGGSSAFTTPMQINQTPQEIGTMINLAVDASGNPTAAWLQGLSLVLARSEDGGHTFSTQVVDTEVCDCCRPQLSMQDDQLFIAYRNSEYDDQAKNIRDVHVGKLDSTGKFAAARVADGHWYLNACPISGPSFTAHDANLLVTWMDGRNDESGHMEHTDVWFALSSDGGETFSSNVRITSEDAAYRKLPALAVDNADRLHIVWAEETPDGGALYYATSTNSGASFSTPQVIVSSGDSARPDNPMLVSAAGKLYLTWTDREGAHLALLTEDQS
jgi:hypothetical protein